MFALVLLLGFMPFVSGLAVQFGHVRASVSAERRWGPVKAGLIFMGCMLGLVGGGLFLRYLSLWYKVRKERVGSTDIQE